MLRQVLPYTEKIALCQCDQNNLFKVAEHFLEGPNDNVLPVGKIAEDLFKISVTSLSTKLKLSGMI